MLAPCDDKNKQKNSHAYVIIKNQRDLKLIA